MPEVDPIQTCDTCIVEVDGKLMRSCSTIATEGMNIERASVRAKSTNRGDGSVTRKSFIILYSM